MKKFFVLAAVCVAMFLMVSCGGSDSGSDDNGNNGGNNSNGNNSGDEDGFYCTDTSSVCSDGSVVKVCGNISGTKGYYDVHGKKFEFDPNDQNSVKEALLKADEECSKTDSNGDSDGEGGESETPADVSECSANGSFPCKDSSTGLIWSARSKNAMKWGAAEKYCSDLDEGGSSDWRLPTISELRTIIQNCEGTVVGGACAVNDPDHLSLVNDDSSDCRCEYKGEDTDYGRLGDGDIWLWSSSVSSDDGNDRWCAVFGEGGLAPIGKDNVNFVRCVKNAE